MKHLLALLAVVTLTACPPIIPEPVVPDATTDAGVDATPPPPVEATPFAACANLGVLRCREADVNCVDTIDHVLQKRLTPFDLECVVRATSKEQVRLCPSIRCP